MLNAREMQARFTARTLKKRVREDNGDRGRVIAITELQEKSMENSTFRVGGFVVSIEYDPSIGLYRGAVSNKSYAVKLTAKSVAELKTRFERLLTVYFGAEAA